MTIERGEVWWADLGRPRGSAPAKRRPIVVVQSQHFNRSELATIVGVAVTTNRRLAAMPGNVLLPASATGLSEDSVANVTQLVTVDRSHLEGRIGMVPGWLLDGIDRGLRRVLDL